MAPNTGGYQMPHSFRRKSEELIERHHGTGRSFGETVADSVVAGMGSWQFIIWQTIAVALWITINLIVVIMRFDPYPFILLNLLFSTQAAYASPLILMSGNRAAARDKEFSKHQFEMIEEIHKLTKQDTEMTAAIKEKLDTGN